MIFFSYTLENQILVNLFIYLVIKSISYYFVLTHLSIFETINSNL